MFSFWLNRQQSRIFLHLTLTACLFHASLEYTLLVPCCNVCVQFERRFSLLVNFNQFFFFFCYLKSFFEGQSASWDVAKKEQNRTKNRYGNIIACKTPIHTNITGCGQDSINTCLSPLVIDKFKFVFCTQFSSWFEWLLNIGVIQSNTCICWIGVLVWKLNPARPVQRYHAKL